MKTARELAQEIAKTMGCNCDLDNWQPEAETGHSWVCRIHKAAKEAYGAQPKPSREELVTVKLDDSNSTKEGAPDRRDFLYSLETEEAGTKIEILEGEICPDGLDEDVARCFINIYGPPGAQDQSHRGAYLSDEQVRRLAFVLMAYIGATRKVWTSTIDDESGLSTRIHSKEKEACREVLDAWALEGHPHKQEALDLLEAGKFGSLLDLIEEHVGDGSLDTFRVQEHEIAVPGARYECPHFRSCGAVFTYERTSIGKPVDPRYCPECGKAMQLPENEELLQKFRDAAHEKWDNGDETDVEVDGVVSIGENGAFVQGWLFVRNSEAGIIAEEATG